MPKAWRNYLVDKPTQPKVERAMNDATCRTTIAELGNQLETMYENMLTLNENLNLELDAKLTAKKEGVLEDFEVILQNAVTFMCAGNCWRLMLTKEGTRNDKVSFDFDPTPVFFWKPSCHTR